jgi:hypothetical protein
LTLTQASPEVRELDLNSFHLWLRDWEDEEEAITRPKTHNHSTEVALAGLTYARIIEILEPYTIEFEDGQYTVNCVGANHNISDRKVANQVSLIVNNAAGLITNTAIEYASFNGGVTIDINNISGKAVSGTEFPIGTPQKPSDNIDDAYAIAEYRGFPTFFVRGDLDITSAVPDLHDYEFIGDGMDRTTIDIESEAVVTDCAYQHATVTGTLDGNSRLIMCQIEDLVYVKGFVEQCVLAPGTITLAGDEEAHFLDCWSGVPGTSTPTINMGGSGQALALRNYNGGIKLTNKTGPEAVSIDLNSGQIILDPTVTNGEIVCRGIGKLTDGSDGATVYADDLLNYENITRVNWSTIWVDIDNGDSGTEFPIGTKQHPVNNMDDAVTIAIANKIERFHLHGHCDMTGDCVNYYIECHNPDDGSVNFNGYSIDCTFDNLTIYGTMGGGHANLTNCKVPSGLSNVDCHMDNCELAGAFTVRSGGSLNADRCTSVAGMSIDCNVDGSVGLGNFSGVATIGNLNSPSSTIAATGHFVLTILDTVTDGVGYVGGIGVVTDLSNGSFVMTKKVLPNAVWDTILTGATYNEPASAGRRLRQLSANVVHEGTVASSTENTITFNGDASDEDGAYDPALITITANTGVGQSRLILEYNGTTKTAVVDRDWKVLPDDTSEFLISGHPGREHVNEGQVQAATLTTVTLNEYASPNDDAYVNQSIFIRSGTGEDQVKRIASYNGTTKVATIGGEWQTIPDNTSGYVMLPFKYICKEDIADEVWSSDSGLQVLTDLSFIAGIEGGRWIISGGQMIFYLDDNTTEIARFNLSYDGDMNPVERTRV